MFDFQEFFVSAEKLVELGGEANVRSGISRYYYSDLGSVRIYLVEVMGENEFLDGHRIHKRIYNRLIESDDNTEVSIGEKLLDLKELRNDADYDWKLDLNHFNEHLSEVQVKSEIILQEVEALRQSPPYKL